MSIRLSCPNGHELIAEDHHAGLKIRCPACKAVCPVPHMAIAEKPIPPAAIAEPEILDDDEPEKLDELEEIDDQEELDELEEVRDDDRLLRKIKKKKKKAGSGREGWSLTNLGLGLHYAKILCFLVIMALFLLLAVVGPFAGVAAAGGGRQAAGGLAAILGLLIIVILILLFVMPILGIVGSLLGFWIPRRTRAAPLIMVSFGLDGGALFLVFLGMVMGGIPSPAGAGAGLIFMLLGFMTGFAGWVLFMIFLRFVARYLGDRVTADESMYVMIYLIILGVGGPIALFLLFLVLMLLGIAGLVIFYGIYLVYLIIFIKVLFNALNLVATIRQQIANRC